MLFTSTTADRLLVCVSSVEVESRDSLLQMENIDDPSLTHFELDLLDPSSHYIFKVIARTAAGDGPPVTRRGATLLEGGEITVIFFTAFDCQMQFLIPTLFMTFVDYSFLFPFLFS